MSVSPSVFPLPRGAPSSEVAPSAEEKWVLQPSLTLIVFILIPCVVLLFFLNCFLIFHRLPFLSLKKRAKRRAGSRGKNPYIRAAQCSLPTGSLSASNKSCDGRCCGISQGLEATLALGECAHVSMDTQSRGWCHKLEETPGLSYAVCPSRTALMPFSSSRSCGVSQERRRRWDEVEDDGGGTRSSMEQETRMNAAPPNTPAVAMIQGTVTPKVKFCRKTSTQRKRLKGVTSVTPLGSVFNNASSIPPEDIPTCLFHNSSSTGPGLDSDFGVSAGVSLHILSSDSDSGSQSWASGMEWDYYDPCYMRKNRLRNENRQNHNLPVICSKQYWV
ncbi:protein huluwa-like [Pyxicephalus adspersus]|uniref:protein huluwa-like n=1 Tax=Pyxicephalus adspersus TaxID=30357 RepID=UPI003B59A727